MALSMSRPTPPPNNAPKKPPGMAFNAATIEENASPPNYGETPAPIRDTILAPAIRQIIGSLGSMMTSYWDNYAISRRAVVTTRSVLGR